MTNAIRAHFYLEASWYEYAVLEDRMVAALMAFGGAQDKKGKPIRMLGPKFTLLNDRKKNDALLAAYFDHDTMKAFDGWKKERDALMHSMADAATSLD